MFDSGFDDENWKDGFRDFMRSARMVKEETIEAYIDYVEKVAAKLGKRYEDLAGSNERLNETLKRLEAVSDWGSKTKSNYKTALNRLNAYLMSRGNATGNNVPSSDRLASKEPGASSAPYSDVASRVKKDELVSMGNEDALLAQINEIEKMVREHEDKTWNSVFKCASTYALGMPSIVIALGINMYGCLLAVLSAVFAFGGAAALVPVLQRPSRQLKEIQEYGERLHFEGKEFGCIHPAAWTAKEKWAIVLSSIALLFSVFFLGLARVVGS